MRRQPAPCERRRLAGALLLLLRVASAYVIISSCGEGARCRDAKIQWARVPKTGSSTILSAVLAIEGPSRPPLVACGADRLDAMAARHQVGCVAPCPPRGPLALAPTATGEDAARAAALLAADLRFAVVREPVDRFAARGRTCRPRTPRSGARKAPTRSSPPWPRTRRRRAASRRRSWSRCAGPPRSRSGPRAAGSTRCSRARGHRARLLRPRPAGRRHRRALCGTVRLRADRAAGQRSPPRGHPRARGHARARDRGAPARALRARPRRLGPALRRSPPG